VLGLCHVLGWGVSRDLPAAYAWLAMAGGAESEGHLLLHAVARDLDARQFQRAHRLFAELRTSVSTAAAP
jgi:TPR repeat protein